MPVGEQIRLSIRYGDIEIESGYLADIVWGGEIILEVKAVEYPHDAQLLTYLRVRSCRTGLLINFNTVSLIAPRLAEATPPGHPMREHHGQSSPCAIGAN
jgi:GxxExxY protein